MDERQESARPRPAPGRDKRVVFVVVLALIGAWTSLTLTNFHLSAGQQRPALFRAVCEMSGGGCDQVLQSSWALLPRGIPLAFAGLVYFSVIALWYLAVGRPNRAGRAWYVPIFALQLLGAVVSLLLLGVMLIQLRTLCGWCALVHVINLVLFWLAWKLWPREPRAEAGPAWPPGRLGFAALLLVLVTAGYWNQWLLNNYLQAESAHFRGDSDLMRYLFFRNPPHEIPIRADDPVRGSATAPHTVVVFSDFQCPACRSFAAFFKREILPSYDVQVVYKHLPLDRDCNSKLPKTLHVNGCEAAYAAEAVRELGGVQGFWKMHDALFEGPADVEAGHWAELAASAGVDGAAVAQRVAQRGHLDRIAEDVELGSTLKLDATPGIFIDGRHLADWPNPELWKLILTAPAEPSPPAPLPRVGEG